MKPLTLLSGAGVALAIAIAFGPSPASAATTTNTSAGSAYSMSPCGRINVDCRDGYKLVCTDKQWNCVAEGKTPTSTCIASCPDGHTYPTCDHLSRPITYFRTDPCLNHDAFPETASCKGPNPLTCKKGTAPACIDNKWACSSANTIDPDAAVVITAVTPQKALVGMNIQLTGKGFKPRNNIVIFADSVIPNLGSTDGKHITFRLPPKTIRPCYLSKEAPCTAPTHSYSKGTYAVWVKAGNNVSNALTVNISR